MRLIDLTCSKCNAILQVNADLKKCICQYCGNEMLIDDEVIHHQVDNAYQAGYQAEMGRQRAIYDMQQMQQSQYINNLQQQQKAFEHVKKRKYVIMLVLIISAVLFGILWYKTGNFKLFIFDAILVGIIFLYKKTFDRQIK